MPRYIDGDALNAAIEKWFDGVCVYDVSPFEAVYDFQSIVDEQPTVSPDEVRDEGCRVCQCKEQLPEDGMSHEYYIRGNTLYHFDTFFGWEGTDINYCPNCGAKMEVTSDA